MSNEKVPFYILGQIHVPTETRAGQISTFLGENASHRVWKGVHAFAYELVIKRREALKKAKIYADGTSKPFVESRSRPYPVNDPIARRERPANVLLALLTRAGAAHVATESADLLEKSTSLAQELPYANGERTEEIWASIHELKQERDTFMADRVANTMTRKDKLGLIHVGLLHIGIVNKLRERQINVIIPSSIYKYVTPEDIAKYPILLDWIALSEPVNL